MSNDFFAYSENPAYYRAALIRSIEEAGQVGHEQLAELRAVYQSGLADQFHARQATVEANKIYRHNDLLKNYHPFELCG